MRRETAYKLAGRMHGHPAESAAALEKLREIRFYPIPAGQAVEAADCLRALGHVQVSLSDQRPDTTLLVRYSVLDHTLEGLEGRLLTAGFHLDQSLYAKLVRSLVYFCEDVQRQNLGEPERLIKKSNEVYMQAYDQHLHGDHDDTPPELRDFR